MMDFERLSQTWRAQPDSPDAETSAYLLQRLAAELKARHRGELLLLALPIAGLAHLTIVVSRGALAGAVSIRDEWGVIAMLGVGWVAAAAVLLARVVASRPRDQGRPLFQALELMLAANRRARSGYRILIAAHPVFVAAVVVAIAQLSSGGKVSGQNSGQLMLLSLGLLAGSAALLWRQYSRVLKPQQQQLESLLGAYRSGDRD